MAGELETPWESESIPDESVLYMRVHRAMLNANGEPVLGAFKDHGGAMSTDWEKYSTPEQTRQRARVPEDNAVISLVVGQVRGIDGLSVEHTPDSAINNRAHVDVYGEKTAEVRVQLRRIYRMILGLK